MISYLDLLERPWAEMNCGEVVAECLRRMGQHEAADAMPTNLEGAQCVDERWVPASTRWQREEGVVILSDNGSELHASCTIGKGMAVTSSRQLGVHGVHVSRIPNKIGLYRWSG